MSKMPAGTTLYPRKQRVRNAMVPRGRAIMPKLPARNALIDPDVTLGYRFTDGTLAPVVGSAALTFARNSVGTYWGADRLLKTAAINEPRFDHDPVSAAALGLLIEGAATNICLQSEDFSTTWAATRASVTTNSVTSPDGSATADTFVEDGTAAQTHILSQSVASLTTSASYTFSVFVKAANRSWVALRDANSTGLPEVFFDVANGVVGTETNGTGVIEDYGNGWYRCSMTSTVTSTTVSWQIIAAEADNDYVFSGLSQDSLYVWGGQFEAGAFPTSYIKTLAAPATRAGEDVGATSISANMDVLRGTVYMAAIAPPAFLASQNYLWRLRDTSETEELWSFFVASAGGRVRTTSITNAVNEIALNSGAEVAVNTAFKTAVAWAFNDVAGYTNGATSGTDATYDPTAVALTRLVIGGAGGVVGSSSFNGHIAEWAYANVRKPDEYLQQITRTVLL